jgi:hypothetical protein
MERVTTQTAKTFPLVNSQKNFFDWWTLFVRAGGELLSFKPQESLVSQEEEK